MSDRTFRKTQGAGSKGPNGAEEASPACLAHSVINHGSAMILKSS